MRRAGARFAAIDGAQWAGALAYSAFASMFPMLLLLITAASFLIDRDRAARAAIDLVESYLPMSDDMRRLILSTIAGMAAARGRAGAAALLILVLVSGQSILTFICATNRAWGVSTAGWRRLPLKSLAFLAAAAGAVPLGMTASMLSRLAVGHLSGRAAAMASGLAGMVLPISGEFAGLSLFYRFAPRRTTRISEVWAAALIATLLLRAAEQLFLLYLREFAAANAVYGVFAGIMALLLWIYLCGCIFIYGACLCAARGGSPRVPFAVPPQ
ncbi:MAG: YihY/virulence factor BrkB family protein [Elusimicrobiota bacterium]